MAMTNSVRFDRPQLARDLGAGHAIAVVIGTVIGSGIFLVPAEMIQSAGSASLVYTAWLVGGLLSFFGALTYAELGALKPQAGGEYIYIRDAYGPLAGFLYAWTWLLIAKPASIATLATGFVRILGNFPALGFLSHNFVSLLIPITYGQFVAVASAVLISTLNYIGVKKAGDFQLMFTILKVAMVVGIVVIGLGYRGGSWHNFASCFVGAKGGMAGFMAALIAALWAYDGWNDLNMVSGEIRDPEHNIPRSLIFGVFSVVMLYMLVNTAVQYVLPAQIIAGSPRPASDAMELVLGGLGSGFVSAGMAVSMLVAMNGTVMSGARLPYAVARDRYFFSALAEVHPRFHTPTNAILLQAGLAIALLLSGGTFRHFFSLAIFAEWLFYMVAATTVFVFRKREPQAARPYRVWGYPVVPALFVLASAVVLYYTFSDNLRSSALGCLVIAAGIPVFFGFAHRRAR
jgi:basic amino acid/polyamine antiporter, APA family